LTRFPFGEKMPAIAEAAKVPAEHDFLSQCDLAPRRFPRTFLVEWGKVLVKKLYIGNLPFQATEEEIGEWFTQTGVTPSSVMLIRDRFTGQPRGFGFVEIQNDEEAQRAVQALNGQQLKGRSIVVNEARPPRDGGGAGGDRGGGGGGRDW
jgi:hypothetical protein